MSTGAFSAIVPDGFAPGQQFLTDCNGTGVWVEVPLGCQPGTRIQFVCPMIDEMYLAEEVQRVFRGADEDGDGMISAIELTHLLTKLGFDEGESQILFEAGDCNHDGELNIAEFAYLYERLKTKLAEKACEDLKTKFDREVEELRKSYEEERAASAAQPPNTPDNDTPRRSIEATRQAYEDGLNERQHKLEAERARHKKRIEERLKTKQSARGAEAWQ